MKKIFAPFIIPLFLFFIFIFIYLTIYKSLPIRFNDENHWIGRGYFFELFIKRDFKNPLWQSFYGYDQPKVANYYYALLFYPQYKWFATQKNENYSYAQYLLDHNFYRYSDEYNFLKDKNPNTIIWDTEEMRSENYLLNRYGEKLLPTLQMVYKARILNIITLSLTVVCVFLLTKYITNTPIALLTASVFGMNDLIINASLPAHSEVVFNFLFIICAYLLIRTLQKLSTNKQRIMDNIFLGICLGLLAQTKINGMIFIIFTLLALFALLIYTYTVERKKHIKSFIKTAVIIIFVSVTIFIAIDPYLYTNPIQKTIKMVIHRVIRSYSHADRKPQFLLVTRQERITQIYNNFLLDETKICHYNGSFIFIEICKRYARQFSYFIILLFITGIYFCAKNLVKNYPLIYVFNLFVFIQISIAGYLILNWDRYYIHLVYFFTFFQILGLYYLTKKMFVTIKQLLVLLSKSRKMWIIPIILFLIIIVMLVVAAQISPVPVFLYPLI